MLLVPWPSASLVPSLSLKPSEACAASSPHFGAVGVRTETARWGHGWWVLVPGGPAGGPAGLAIQELLSARPTLLRCFPECVAGPGSLRSRMKNARVGCASVKLGRGERAQSWM